MKGKLCVRAAMAVFFFVCSSMAHAGPQRATVAEERAIDIDLLEASRFSKRAVEIHEPGASFIKVHFSDFNVPKGVTVVVRNPESTEAYRYQRGAGDPFTFDRRHGDDGWGRFSAMSIDGDTAVIEILGKIGNLDSLKHRVRIDYYWAGYPESQLDSSGGDLAAGRSSLQAGGGTSIKPESTCGADQRVRAVCWEDSHPAEFDRSWPVARLLIEGSGSCTAWRVGSQNRMFTNNHCISSQDELDATEVWFNYQHSSCSGSALETTVKVPAGTLLRAHQILDFAVFTVENFDQVAPFGHLGLDVRDAALGEGIYLPQHGLGYPKQIAIESDMNASGLCEVDDTDHDAYGDSTDLGYFCDTRGGSSGSPVLATATDRVIALHHFGGCVNSGVKMSLIWPEVADLFGGEIPDGDNGSGSPNTAPDANFVHSCNETSCTFDASSSTDSDGQITQYAWQFGDGVQGSGMTPSHQYPDSGSYTVTLTVTDDDGDTDLASQTVIVDTANQAPTAAFSVDCTDLSCTYDGSLSSDADGSIQSFHWTFGDGATASGASATTQHTYPQPGQYPVTLEVVDDDGASGTADATVTVTDSVNQAPEAQFSYSCTELACDFDAGASTDPDGSIVGYNWDFGDGASGQTGSTTASHVYDAAGTYTVELTVEDGQGATDTVAETVTVIVINDPPVADFTYSCEGLTCTFDGSDSHDPDGTIHQYDWKFGDGSFGQGAVVTHQYTSGGVFDVRLTVADDVEASSSISKAVEVISAPPPSIQLLGSSDKHRGSKWVDLSWSGASGSEVEIHRDGDLLVVTANDGFWRDEAVANRDKRFTYRVCDSDGACSADVVVNL